MVRAGVLVSFFSSLLVLGSHAGNTKVCYPHSSACLHRSRGLWGISIPEVVFHALFRVCGLIS